MSSPFIRLTSTQLALLEHLAAVAVEQKATARRTKKRFNLGWTTITFGRHVRPATLERLEAHGLIARLGDSIVVRITRLGVIELETRLGEVIYA